MTQLLGSPIGIHAPQGYLAECGEIGAGFARLVIRGDLQVGRVQSAVASLANYGVKPIITMRHTTEPMGRAGLPPDMPKWLERVTLFARSMPSVQFWQVDNEMWQWLGSKAQYLDFLERTGAAIKAVNPTAKILAIAMAGGVPLPNSENAKAVDAILSAPTLWDIFDFHNYSDRPEDMGEISDWINAEMVRRNVQKFVWCMETGGPWLYYTSAEHASAVVKRLVIAAEAEVGVTCWAGMYPAPELIPEFNRLALITANEQRTPAFYTYKLLAKMLSGATSIERVPWTHADLVAYRIERLNTPPCVVAWARSGQTQGTLPKTVQQATVTPIITRPGQFVPEPQVVTPTRGRIRINVTTTPIFVEIM